MTVPRGLDQVRRAQIDVGADLGALQLHRTDDIGIPAVQIAADHDPAGLQHIGARAGQLRPVQLEAAVHPDVDHAHLTAQVDPSRLQVAQDLGAVEVHRAQWLLDRCLGGP